MGLFFIVLFCSVSDQSVFKIFPGETKLSLFNKRTKNTTKSSPNSWRYPLLGDTTVAIVRVFKNWASMGINRSEQTPATRTRYAHQGDPRWTEDQPHMRRGSHRSIVQENLTLPLLSLESPESQGTRTFTEE